MFSQNEPVGLSTRFNSGNIANNESIKSLGRGSSPIPPPSYSLLPQYGGLVMAISIDADGNDFNTANESPHKSSGLNCLLEIYLSTVVVFKLNIVLSYHIYSFLSLS